VRKQIHRHDPMIHKAEVNLWAGCRGAGLGVAVRFPKAIDDLRLLNTGMNWTSLRAHREGM
jgi:hypothetical protein